MGFLDKVNVELKERGRTLTPGNQWNQIETMTVGYGHGIAVTPAAPRLRIRHLVQRRDLPACDPAQG